MPRLHIALQEGFMNDTVSIRINGEKVFHKEAVTTRLQIGLADTLEFDTPQGSVNVEIDLPLRHLSESTALNISTTVYLGISILPEGRISFNTSHEPFGYL